MACCKVVNRLPTLAAPVTSNKTTRNNLGRMGNDFGPSMSYLIVNFRVN